MGRAIDRSFNAAATHATTQPIRQKRLTTLIQVSSAPGGPGRVSVGSPRRRSRRVHSGIPANAACDQIRGKDKRKDIAG